MGAWVIACASTQATLLVPDARFCHETVPDVGQSLPVATVAIRHAEPGDHARVSPHLDEWWGGRPMRAMLPRLFFEHFRDTSFVAQAEGELVRLLCGLLSPRYPDPGYVH